MSKIIIPPAALEAGRIAFAKAVSADPWQDPIRAAFVAMVEAWPGMQRRIHIEQAIILPLMENPDAEA